MKKIYECTLVALTIIGLAVGVKIALKPRQIEIIPAKAQTTTPIVITQPSPIYAQKNPDLKAYVQEEAKEAGVNPKVADFIVQHESQYNPTAVGDFGTSKGLWQIHLPDHPDITEAQALDPVWSTKWALKEILAGRISEWSSWNNRNKWYND